MCLPLLYANITRIPYELMSAIIIVYCITGVYSSEASTFQVLLAVIIGAFSFLLRKLDSVLYRSSSA